MLQEPVEVSVTAPEFAGAALSLLFCIWWAPLHFLLIRQIKFSLLCYPHVCHRLSVMLQSLRLHCIDSLMGYQSCCSHSLNLTLHYDPSGLQLQLSHHCIMS